MTTTATKERPIIMAGESVRAILDGRKTQTRRVMKPPPFPCDHAQFTEASWKDAPTAWVSDDDGDWFCDCCGNGINSAGESIYRCPYGQPGDKLWARECWSPDHAAFYPHFPIVYRSDQIVTDDEIRDGMIQDGDNYHPFRWRSPLHMSKTDSRLTLEVMDVKIEQVQNISSRDAWAEGACCDCTSPVPECAGNIDAYQKLWDSINGKRKGGIYAWDKNPWVWAVTFKRVTP